MKTNYLLFFGICCTVALTPPSINAQTREQKLNDTIVFVPNENTKILFIGDNLYNLIKYKNLDSLKKLFMTDFEKARQQPDYPIESKKTHYFVHRSGKRRLKSENEGFQEAEINVEKERKNLDLELPGYEYIIHDFVDECELQIFVNNPSQLSQLIAINLDDAIKSIASDKKNLKRRNIVEFKKINDQWKMKDSTRPRYDMLELTTHVGLTMLNSQLAPILYGGVNLSWIITDKYNSPRSKIGYDFDIYPFFDFTTSNTTAISSHGLNWMFPTTKNEWYGLGVSYLHSKNTNLSLNGAFKISAIKQFSNFRVSFEAFAKNKQGFYGITLQIPF